MEERRRKGEMRARERVCEEREEGGRLNSKIPRESLFRAEETEGACGVD